MVAPQEPSWNNRVVRNIALAIITAILLYGLAQYLLDGSGGFIQLESGTDRSR